MKEKEPNKEQSIPCQIAEETTETIVSEAVIGPALVSVFKTVVFGIGKVFKEIILN